MVGIHIFCRNRLNNHTFTAPNVEWSHKSVSIMKLWKTNNPQFITTKKRQNGLGDPFFYFLSTFLQREDAWRPSRTVGPNVKNPSKVRLKLFAKLTEHTCVVPLTIWQVLIRKRKLFENSEMLLGKACEITLVNLFLVVFSHLESYVQGCAKRRAWSEQTSWDDHLDWIRKQNVNKRQKGRQTLRSNTLSSFACFPMGPGSPIDMPT